MDQKQRTSIFTFFLTVLPLLLQPAHAVQKTKELKQEIKCVVELYGGDEAIYFTVVTEKQRKQLAKALVGEKMWVPSQAKKQTIYRVGECKPLNEPFTLAKDRALDERTPR
jgi:hypothetical protein